MSKSDNMHDRFRLDGKVAVVTGGGRGIGRGIAEGFADCGANVVVAARRKDDVEGVAKELEAKGVKAMGVSCDVMDFEAVPKMLDQVMDEFGQLDIWVNNAGGNLDRKMYALPDIPLEKWQEQIQLNLTSKFWGAQQAAKRMTDGGRIISIVSVAAHNPSPGFGAYSSANNAVIAMTRTMALELAPRGITVNTIAPGIVVTDMFVETLGMSWEDAEAYAAQENPLGRTGYPADVGAAACFFASPAAEWITGQCIDVAGGR